MTQQELDQTYINTIRTLSRDAMQSANSGYSLMLQGDELHCIAVRSFGASAPIRDLQKGFGFTVAQVVEAAR